MKNILLVYSICVVTLSSCNTVDKKGTVADPQAAAQELIAADKAFSALCEMKGMKHAFIEYIDSNGVLLRSGHMPIIGANAIDFLVQQDDSGYTLNWEPRHAAVARSGEMGYTYGIYAMHPKEQDTVIYGSYVSIWKKQQDGKWKLMLDTGNEGLGEE